VTSRTEALPLTILEAMAVGKPLLAAAVGGIPVVVAHDETGQLVDDNGSVAELLARRDGRR
jgi:glycosyltransferase involved in cell wall biosynthesis